MNNMPQHVAFIMDGNGRWAKERNLPRTVGHWHGSLVIKEILRTANELNIPYITLFAFSAENFSRPKNEVNYLMRLFERFIKKEGRILLKNKIRFRTIGDISQLPVSLQAAIIELIDNTSRCDGLQLTVAINYGARQEVARAINRLINDDRFDTNKQLNWGNIVPYLDTSMLPDPDLIIRTSGEQRLSNFLLLQAAYSEFYFTNVYWPDFTRDEFLKAIASYQQRDRRVGNIHDEKSNK